MAISSKTRKTVASIVTVGYFGILVLGFQNCAPQSFSAAQDQATFASSPVFASGPTAHTNPPTPWNFNNGPGHGGNNGGGSGGGNILPNVSSTSMPIEFLCSNKYSKSDGGNLASAAAAGTGLFVQLVPANSGSSTPACSFTDANLANAIFQNKTFPFSIIDQNCPNLAAGSYSINVMVSSTTQPLDGSPNVIPIVEKSITNGSSSYSMPQNQVMWLVADYNPQESSYPDPISGNGFLKLTSQSQCDKSASPLVIRIARRGQKPEILALTSPAQGIMFDILGANAAPTPYTDNQISWFTNQPEFFLLSLPDANGNIQSVDQLFGNNTKGPDGEFAANGFLALKKYDSNGDGVIDAKDPVFHQLRLWQDANHDGIAQASELVTPQIMGVTSIGLNYDLRFSETDVYGNQIKFKSIVKVEGEPDQIMFDLWFITK
jgi:hypothetical protein